MLGIVLKNIALFFVSILFESVYAQEIDPDQLRLKEIYAARVQTPPVLDGLLFYLRVIKIFEKITIRVN